MGPLQRNASPAPTASSQDRPRLRRRERTSLVKNRMREIRTSGPVRGGAGNDPTYSAQNKAAVYDLLFRAAAETLLTIAADPKHLGARMGATAVLHTWGHPHVHMIVPGGGISPD